MKTMFQMKIFFIKNNVTNKNFIITKLCYRKRLNFTQFIIIQTC